MYPAINSAYLWARSFRFMFQFRCIDTCLFTCKLPLIHPGGPGWPNCPLLWPLHTQATDTPSRNIASVLLFYCWMHYSWYSSIITSYVLVFFLFFHYFCLFSFWFRAFTFMSPPPPHSVFRRIFTAWGNKNWVVFEKSFSNIWDKELFRG